MSDHNSIQRLEILLHITFWSLFVLLFTLVFARVMSVEDSLLRALLNIFPILGMCYANNLLLVDGPLEKRRYLVYLLWSVLLLTATTLLRTWINQFFPIQDIEFLPLTKPFFYLSGAFLTNIGFLSFSSLYQLLKNSYERQRLTAQIISERNEAELRFLKAQINPHFLFNTLNNIYSMAVTNSKNTSKMVLQLSEILRYVIYESRARKVLLAKEVQHIEKLITLFQMRNETPRNIRFLKSGTFTGVQIEPMILIPLVENCFKHTDFDTNAKACAKIELTVQGNTLMFKTTNTKNDADRQKDKVGGVGLENIRKRLYLLYKQQYKLRTKDLGDRFSVHLEIPLNYANDTDVAG